MGGKPSRKANPLQSGVIDFLSAHNVSGDTTAPLQDSDIPKRYTRYGSLLLLGATFRSHTAAWSAFFSSLTEDGRDQLMQRILARFGHGVTHVAVNAPISPVTANAPTEHDGIHGAKENTMRSPASFQPLYGNFGPASLLAKNVSQPSEDDFEQAYWTETIQLRNITQVWAPRWTMFSRGNISEKARVLQDGKEVGMFPGLMPQELGEDVQQTDVIDFYVGIGYFAFCYLARGVRRVWGWEINGWSVEALRRGCVKNGWGCRLVRLNDNGCLEESDSADRIVNDIMAVEGSSQAIRCVVIQGDNRWASKIMKEISESVHRRSKSKNDSVNIRHCNLGLLPTSRGSWEGALQVLHPNKTGWLHVHENADVTKIEEMRDAIIDSLTQLDVTPERTRNPRAISCEHIERVKTYAPGVMHCVFDMQVRAPQ